MSTQLISQIRTISQPPSVALQTEQVRSHIDAQFGDLDSLLYPVAGPSKRRKRNLEEEIQYWEEKELKASQELEETSKTLPLQIEQTQEKLQALLSSAQDLSLQRYSIADKIANLVSEISSPLLTPANDAPSDAKQGESILGQLEVLQGELSRLEAGLQWAQVLEQVIILSEKVLDPNSHRPSPLAALPHYRELNDLIERLQSSLPPEMALMRVVIEVRERTWQALKDPMSENLLKACEPLGWPKKVTYESVSAEDRRRFESAFKDLLYLQAEGEDLHGEERPAHWSAGKGLYPLQAMIKPIELRFQYHFMGKKGTNRVDKPEWAFANILDQIYEHQSFLSSYAQRLASSAGYEDIDVKSEFTLLSFPILLSLLRNRIPHLLDHPALLAHTVYQTVIFDEAIKEGGFQLDSTSLFEDRESAPWEGLSGVILREKDWFERWLQGEKKFADNQLNEIISSPEAWTIGDEVNEDEEGQSSGLRPTISGRQVKALVEQITDRYAPLPDLTYKLPFLLSVQLPILQTYLSRISGSLDAFETLSSAFVRAVPGALAGNTRSGVHIDQAKLTSGKNGLERLMKAWLSSKWVEEGMRKWTDELFLVEISSDLAGSQALRYKHASDPLLPSAFKGPSTETDPSTSVFDILLERYDHLSSRAEEMIVKLITVETENDLKQHLTRKWDRPPSAEPTNPPSYLLSALTTYSSHLSSISSTLPPLVLSRIYRKVVDHISNHILQRGVYAGWSKFSEYGGKDLEMEIKEWKEVSSSSISSSSSSIPGPGLGGLNSILAINIDVPWKKLENISRVLALPTGEAKDTVTFAQAMASAWAGEEVLKVFNERLGVRLGKEELQGILRRRVECWR
ncbi:uncharacterized protein I303_103718 [Kwoniella dejecticola CBS 10117]|uniref:RINT-1 family protein n=1 Tax=Kwoniella dejecticola CBS 10117 TaxID=1296121 RepID=A0A1A6A7I6_9TREE|nr:uncharacterized protein I303_03735 [Kwoniella dejecticola CBS 10117]OBR86018.1 hypothetical protein I303_03735 [Kwoniella dejecticola CBS 10117]